MTTRSALSRSQRGFTLVELLIVVLIIGLLAAIAIPVFNGQRSKAKNAGATSSLTSAFRSGYSEYTSAGGTWGGFGAESTLAPKLSAAEAAYNFRPFAPGTQNPATVTAAGWSQGQNDITVSVEDTDMITLCNKSKSGLYFCLRSDSTGQLPTVAATGESLFAKIGLSVPEAQAAETVVRSTGSTEVAARAALANRCNTKYTYPATMTSTAYPTAYSCSTGAVASADGANGWVSTISPAAASTGGTGGTSTGGTGGTSTGGTGGTGGSGGGSSTPTMSYNDTVASLNSSVGCLFNTPMNLVANDSKPFNCSGGVNGQIQQPQPPVAQTIVGAVPSNSTNVGLQFNGLQHYSLADSAGPMVPAGANGANKAWSMEIWAKTTNPNATQGIAAVDDSWALSFSGGNVVSSVRTAYPWGVESVTSSGVSIQANTWYHIVQTWDNGTLRVYVNGVKRGERTGITYLHNGQKFTVGYIGSGGWSGTGPSYLNGAIDELHWYPSQLSNANVSDLYAAGTQ